MYHSQASQELFEIVPVGMYTCMTSMRYGLVNIFEGFGCYVDGSRSDLDSPLRGHFKVYGRVILNVLHGTPEKIIKR